MRHSYARRRKVTWKPKGYQQHRLPVTARCGYNVTINSHACDPNMQAMQTGVGECLTPQTHADGCWEQSCRSLLIPAYFDVLPKPSITRLHRKLTVEGQGVCPISGCEAGGWGWGCPMSVSVTKVRLPVKTGLNRTKFVFQTA